jgi:hypothetical protein
MDTPRALAPPAWRVALSRWADWGLPAIVTLYLVVALLFAVLTPAWQAPDEPAHFNYVRQLATGGGLPVLDPGDYCQPCIEDLLRQGFPPGAALEALDYEAHQPPLYYLLAVPVYLASGGALLALRLFSAALGAGLIWLSGRVAFAVLAPDEPDRPLTPRAAGLALASAAFAGLLPQHVALLASVNNDGLAELLLAGLLLVLVPCLRAPAGEDTARRLGLASLLLGLAFWTKATAYLGAGLIVLAVLLRREPGGVMPSGGLLRRLALGLGPALLIGLPWWLRNAALYGALDPLGLQWHNVVAAAGGQPTTADWLASFGAGEFARRLLQTTFQSFWGQFGWMGVVLDGRVYYAAALLTGLALGGLALAAPAWPRLAAGTRRALLLLAGLVVLALAAFALYNLTFVQHQGRYLYPALIPLALGLCAGWQQLLASGWRGRLAALAAALLGGAAWVALAGPALGRWLLIVPAGLALLVALGPGLRRLLPLALAAALAALALASLFGAIVPQLSATP